MSAPTDRPPAAASHAQETAPGQHGGALMARLKIETADAHAETERQLDPQRLTASVGEYAAVLGAFYGFYEPFEGRLAAAPATERERTAQRPLTRSPRNPPHDRLIQQTLTRLTRCRTVAEVSDVVAEEVRAFTGFDRVMICKFEEDGHGWVVAESRADDVGSCLDLRFPASDVPQQARRLYEMNWLRLIADSDYGPSPLVPAENPSTGRPLDLSKSVLRSVSPIHVRYLKNMSVASSMSVSLMRGERLWELIACHHRTARFVTYAARAACVLFATVLSAQVVAVEQNRLADERAERRELLAAPLRSVAGRGTVTAGLDAEPERLLALVGASRCVGRDGPGPQRGLERGRDGTRG